jgi:hypothetical protein
MNKLVSGAIGFTVPLNSNKIYLPDILDLKDKRIKHIDLCDMVQITADGKTCTTGSASGCYLNIQEQNTKELKIKSLSVEMLRLSKNSGNRIFINKIIDFPNSFIEWNGTIYPDRHLFFVAWFDEPKIMHRVVETGKTAIDSFEVLTTNNPNKKFFFGENRTLFNRMFQNILFYSPDSIGTTPKGYKPVRKGTERNSFVTLQKENYQFIRNVPLYIFDQQSVTYPIRLQNVEFDFTNSFIEVAPIYPITPGQSFMFNAEIDDNN